MIILRFILFILNFEYHFFIFEVKKIEEVVKSPSNLAIKEFINITLNSAMKALFSIEKHRYHFMP